MPTLPAPVRFRQPASQGAALAAGRPAAIAFDPEMLRRHDRPGPRYTSYPSAPHFSADFGEAALRAEIVRSNQEPLPRPLSLYAHIPFCTHPCFYCGCNRVITRDRSRGEAYLLRLLREIAMMAPLFDRDRDVVQLHLGGGTPTFLGQDRIAVLIESLDRHFHFSRHGDLDFSIELDPRFVDRADVLALAAIGFNRASLGVQDFDPQVQEAVNRTQSIGQTLDIIDACREAGLRSVNIDLIYGLPRQGIAGFGRTLDTVIAARPERIAVYGYAHLPDTFRAQRQIEASELPDAEGRLALLALAVTRLSDAGYVHIGMDHFALPDDDLARAAASGDLHRNFMGYTTHADTDLLGLGVSAISRIGDSFSQHPRDLASWETAVDSGRLPVWRGLHLGPDDLLRADVIQQLMCRGEIDIGLVESRHDVVFHRHFADALARLALLQADGLVELGPEHIRASNHGRLLLRIIAMCFDAYLNQPAAAPVHHSRAI